MPTLHWVGKDKVVNHHHEVPFRLLDKQYTFTANEGTPANSTANRIIHGDNLEALKSLLPEFEGKVNCIYIDPPYNTGNEGWVYNDAVNDPKIKKWLGQVVGKEGEDLSRHDKWLCMMYPRLKLLHRLLAHQGIIFVSLDDNECANMKLMLDEIFGQQNFFTNIIWEKNDSPKMDSTDFSIKHDYVLCYAKSKIDCKILPINSTDEDTAHYNKVDSKGRRYYLKPLRAMGGQGETREARPNLYYAIEAPDGSEIFPKRKDGTDGAWRWSREKLQSELDRIEWSNGKGGWSPNYKIFLEETSTRPPESIWYHSEVGSNRTSKAEINDILIQTNIFNTPKPSRLIERVLSISLPTDGIVLDSFAGSGTTAHAVLKLNAQDGGNRRFILCEMMEYAETITAERVRRVMNGYGEGTKAVAGTGGAFDYYTVGAALFKEDKNLNEDVGADAIRHYVAYTESIPPAQQCGTDSLVSRYALGASDTALWLFYYERDRVTTLNLDFLASLNIKALLEGGAKGGTKPKRKRPEHFIVYADKCALDKDFLTQHGITFKRIPRDITRF
ncbi:MAG: site-specific DNA-methyltransferase [Alphaproteobacteria bacterium]|nr:site-specific DNA-methyltransferase [Alphaproteobacteria bacterium]